MTAAVLAAPLTSAVTAVAHGSTALWYLTRATGLVALVLLTATVVLGVIASVGWTAERWPRFLSQTLHRNLSLLCIVLVGVHVVTTVGDGYVPITLLDAVVPFRSPYRPLWVGLGAVAFDLLLAVLVTSALRHRIGYQSWRFVHWLAYLCWPIALFHALGSGTDTPLPAVLALEALCGAAVLASLVWRFTTGRIFTPGQRTAALLGATAVTVAAVAFAALGPLRPDWSHRSGTSSALLSQLTPHAGTTAPSSGAATGTGVPAVPFDVAVSGTESETGPDTAGNVQVVLTLALQDAAATPLTVTLTGTAAGEGLALSSGTVTIGGTPGTVTGLDGGSITASIGQADPYQLTLQLTIDQSTGTVSGTAVGSPAPVTGSSGVEGS
jgi:hypothetical protein